MSRKSHDDELRKTIAVLETELKERAGAEGRFRTVCDLTPIPILLYRDNVWIYANRAAERLSGYSSEELMGRYVFDIIHPDYRPLAQEYGRKRQRGEEIDHTYEVKIVTRDNMERWVRITGTSIAIDGRLTALVAVSDITRRKEIEADLTETQGLFQAFMDNSPVNAWLKDDKARYIYYNMASKKHLGLLDDGWYGKTNEELWPANVARELTANDRMILATDEPARFEERTIGNDGTEHVWWTCKFPFRDAEGLRYVGGIALDITERKKLEDELRTHRDDLNILVAERTAEMQQEILRRKVREEQYLALVNSIIEWVWETDVDFVHTYVSPRVFNVLGYKPDELVGRSPAAIMPAEEIRGALPLIRNIIAARKSFASFQNVCLHKDGRLIFIEANGHPFFDDEGNLLGYRGSCQDVTERKRTIDALEQCEDELTVKSNTLQEINSTLRILLKQREEDRRDLERNFVSNIREMVLPYVRILQRARLDPRYRAHLDIITTNLNEIISPFLNTIRQLNFTPKEIEVVLFIKEGRTTREIAKMMGVAKSAIDSHRNNIRIKLGLNNKKINLRTYLLSLKE